MPFDFCSNNLGKYIFIPVHFVAFFFEALSVLSRSLLFFLNKGNTERVGAL